MDCCRIKIFADQPLAGGFINASNLNDQNSTEVKALTIAKSPRINDFREFPKMASFSNPLSTALVYLGLQKDNRLGDYFYF